MRERIIGGAIDLVEKGWVPDRVTRFAIRQLCSRRLQGLESNGDLAEFMRQSRRQPIAPVPEKANEQHYEVPAEFFETVLGSRRKYSCCYWEEGVRDLDRAEQLALELTTQHAELSDGQSVLELGCGWGSLTLWMLQQYPQMKVTAVSNSHSQREFILSEARRQGFESRLQVITCDMNDFDISHKFDRVVSVEMFEHMANHQRLLERIRNWIQDDGKMFVHVFCHRRYAYRFEAEGRSDWMSRYFFTGGIMPSRDLLSRYDEHFEVVDDWYWDGRHYRDTCDAWLHRMDRHKHRVLEIFQRTYGANCADLWFQRWRMFFMAGAELFGYDDGREWLVGHYRLQPKSRGSKSRGSKPRG